jgi:hypothetical protein
LPSDVLRNAGSALQREVEIAFDACRDAVHAELARYNVKLTKRPRKSKRT